METLILSRFYLFVEEPWSQINESSSKNYVKSGKTVLGIRHKPSPRFYPKGQCSREGGVMKKQKARWMIFYQLDRFWFGSSREGIIKDTMAI